MTERTVFECDVTGEKFNDRREVSTLEEWRRSGIDPFKVTKGTIHLSDDALDDSPRGIGVLSVVKRIYVESGEIVAVGIKRKSDSYSNDHHISYEERDSVMVKSHEPFLSWLEDEVVL